MKKLILAVLCLFFLWTKAQTFTWNWAKSFGGNIGDGISSMVVTNDNAVVVTGFYFSTQMNIGTTTLMNTNPGSSDFFIAKFDLNGSPIWAKTFGGTASDASNSISADSVGNIYIAGGFQSQSIALETYTLNNFNNVGNSDIFTAKFDPNGNILWAKRYGDYYSESTTAITTDRFGNFYLGGVYSNFSLSFDFITIYSNSSSSSEGFIAKFDQNGNPIWANSYGGSSSDIINSLAVDQSGNCFATGKFESTSMIVGTTTLTGSYGGDIFLMKIDKNGSAIWAKSNGGTGTDDSKGVIVDQQGNSYITGFYASPSITFGPTTLNNTDSNGDVFVVKYDNFGNVVWAKRINSSGSGSFDVGNSITIDNVGNVYVAGEYSGAAIIFGPNTISNSGSKNTFLVKFDINGNPQSALSPSSNYSSNTAQTVQCDNYNNMYVGGKFFSPTIFFGPTLLTNTSNNGTIADAFIAKIGNFTGLISEELIENITLFPNPNNGEFYIKTDASNKILNIEIYNLLGELIEFKYENKKISLLREYPGIYFIKFLIDKKTITKKIEIK